MELDHYCSFCKEIGHVITTCDLRKGGKMSEYFIQVDEEDDVVEEQEDVDVDEDSDEEDNFYNDYYEDDTETI